MDSDVGIVGLLLHASNVSFDLAQNRVLIDLNVYFYDSNESQVLLIKIQR